MTRKKVQMWIGVAVVGVTLAVGSAVSLAAGSSKTAMPKPPTRPGAGAPAVAIPLRANLSASQVASLQVASTATGRFIGGLVRAGVAGRTERPNPSWSLFWAIGVQNTTGQVTGVEIRTGEVSAAASASVFLTLCNPCKNTVAAAAAGTPSTTLLGGTIRNLTQDQLKALRTSELFVNVLTAANPAGELRGPITRRSPVTSGAPPNNRMPAPIKPGPPQTIGP